MNCIIRGKAIKDTIYYKLNFHSKFFRKYKLLWHKTLKKNHVLTDKSAKNSAHRLPILWKFFNRLNITAHPKKNITSFRKNYFTTTMLVEVKEILKKIKICFQFNLLLKRKTQKPKNLTVSWNQKCLSLSKKKRNHFSAYCVLIETFTRYKIKINKIKFANHRSKILYIFLSFCFKKKFPEVLIHCAKKKIAFTHQKSGINDVIPILFDIFEKKIDNKQSSINVVQRFFSQYSKTSWFFQNNMDYIFVNMNHLSQTNFIKNKKQFDNLNRKKIANIFRFCIDQDKKISCQFKYWITGSLEKNQEKLNNLNIKKISINKKNTFFSGLHERRRINEYGSKIVYRELSKNATHSINGMPVFWGHLSCK